MQVILSPFILGSTTAAAGFAGSQHWLAGVAFVVIAGLVIGATSAAQETRRARQRWRALQHRLPFDSRLV